jgi:hypothetical protein
MEGILNHMDMPPVSLYTFTTTDRSSKNLEAFRMVHVEHGLGRCSKCPREDGNEEVLFLRIRAR